MKVGERVRHVGRPELGVGRVTRLYADGHCDVVYADSTFSWIELSTFTLVEAEEVAQEIQNLLNEARYEEAEICHAQYEAYMPRAEFEDRVQRAKVANDERVAREQLALVTRERDQLRADVEVHLDEWDFKAADEVYESACAGWWPIEEYKVSRARAVSIKDFVQFYPSASLAALDAKYAGSINAWLPADDCARLKLPKLKMRLARLGINLNAEQLLACARAEKHRLIRARAGSGKTATLAALAAMVINDEALVPDQVLVLAFNKKAANEIGERIRGAAGVDDFRNARTFHGLAWQLADHAGRDLMFDDGNLAPSRRKQSGFVERLIGSIINPAFRENMYEFFRKELDQVDRLGSGLSKEDYAIFRRGLVDYAMGGEAVKSKGEKYIADFLFEHGISYKYEKTWSWDRKDRLHGAAYRPDFSVMHCGRDVIIEHWAVNPSDPFAKVPEWWDVSTQQYLEQVQDKRGFWSRRGVTLLETHAGVVGQGREAFEEHLRLQLEDAGVECRKIPHDELVQRVADAPRNVSRIAELFLQFISRAKKSGFGLDKVTQIVRDAADPEPRNRVFHSLALHAFAAYEKQLVVQSAMDFDDLLISAADAVKKDGAAARLLVDRENSVSLGDLRWILIDEFQDFSGLYFRLISEILTANPLIRVVAVGDDWQAINGFAGAQLSYFNDFTSHFCGAGVANIKTNHRSGRAIVGGGNLLMEGKGDPAFAYREFAGDISVVAVDKVWLENESNLVEIATNVPGARSAATNWELARALKACVDSILASVIVDPKSQGRWMPSVMILARTGRVYGVSLSAFGACLSAALHSDAGLQNLSNEFVVISGESRPVKNDVVPIEIITAHKSKGKEADTVIVLEAVGREFPKIHADNQLFALFGSTAANALEEERRLFYVAATRAKCRLIFFGETNKNSPYLEVMLSGRLARRPLNGEDDLRLASDEGRAIKTQLGRLDDEFLIRQNVSSDAVRAWDTTECRALGCPEVGYSPVSRLHAELAWPTHVPPIAILTGRNRRFAEQWRQLGWVVY